MLIKEVSYITKTNDDGIESAVIVGNFSIKYENYRKAFTEGTVKLTLINANGEDIHIEKIFSSALYEFYYPERCLILRYMYDIIVKESSTSCIGRVNLNTVFGRSLDHCAPDRRE